MVCKVFLLLFVFKESDLQTGSQRVRGSELNSNKGISHFLWFILIHKVQTRKLAREENEKKEKRKGGWDVAPQGYEGMSVGEVAAQGKFFFFFLSHAMEQHPVFCSSRSATQ